MMSELIINLVKEKKEEPKPTIKPIDKGTSQ